MGCLSENDVSDFDAGRLSPERRREIEAHLEDCEACLYLVGTAWLGQQGAPKARREVVGRRTRGPIALAVVAMAAFGALVASRVLARGEAEPFPHRVAVLHDPSAELAADAVAALPESAFEPTRAEHANFGFVGGTLWLRVTLGNPGAEPRDVVLDATREWVDEVDCYELGERGAAGPAHSGARVPLARRPIASERIAFPVALGPGQTKTLLVRLRGRSPLSFRGEILTEAQFTERAAGDQLLFGGFYAILWGLAAYSLLLFATLGDRTQLLVGLLLAFYGLAEAMSHGHVSRLLPFGAGWFEISGGAAAFSAFVAAIMLLARAVLDFSSRPRVRRASRIVPWILAGVAAVPVAIPALHFLVFLALLGGIAVIAAALAGFGRRDTTTLCFSLATGALIVPGAVTVAVLFGLLPAYPIVEYGNHVGAVVMSCLFSLLVAAAIRGQREHIATLNEELRYQVAARSRELGNVLAGSAARVGVPEVSPGSVFEERYRVVRHLGDGAWGRVFEVSRTSDERRLALKVVTHVRSGAEAARVAREAEIGARLVHPNLVAIVDVGIAAAGSPFIAMELAAGGPLEAQRDRFGDARWAAPLLLDMARGIQALHRARIVHRDLKPSNVLLDGDPRRPRAKLADFGIAHVDAVEGFAPGVDALAATASPGPVGARAALTQTGAVFGTPAYMAPEAFRGARFVGLPADVFALGLMACEMLTGRPGSAQGSSSALVAAKLAPRLAHLLASCIAVDPRNRPSIDDVVEALER